jgi:hypothetical protein
LLSFSDVLATTLDWTIAVAAAQTTERGADDELVEPHTSDCSGTSTFDLFLVLF